MLIPFLPRERNRDADHPVRCPSIEIGRRKQDDDRSRRSMTEKCPLSAHSLYRLLVVYRHDDCVQ